jgi:CubicO group peptidase (beta-lactamase class C family)
MSPGSPLLQKLAQRRIVGPKVAPGAAIAWAARGAQGWVVQVAAAGVRSETLPQPISADTLFDLASVTKPFLALLAARMAQKDIVHWQEPLADLLPETRGLPAGAATIEQLLAHRAGLEAHLELFAPLARGEPFDPATAIQQAAAARRKECAGRAPTDGFAPVYSDLGYLLLGEALSRAYGGMLDEAIAQEVSRPLGIEAFSARQWRQFNPQRFSMVAPTETVGYRGGEIIGRVHDDNAWAWAGEGTAGHAGLFAPALAVARLGMSVLDALAGRATDWLSPRSIAWLVRRRPGGTLRAGFDGKSARQSSVGRQFDASSFGHLGFTGTSLWCDPSAQIVAVLLSNRVCPTRQNTRIRQIRPAVHGVLHRLAARAQRSGASQATWAEPNRAIVSPDKNAKIQ